MGRKSLKSWETWAVAARWSLVQKRRKKKRITYRDQRLRVKYLSCT